ncbi:glucosaminidase domain-containing protein [Halocola ammonii]
MRNALLLLVLVSQSIFAQAENGEEQRLTRSQYIEMWQDEAIYQMVVHGIPASITLAQGILESGNGNSELARKANNHFGIKCHSSWTGKKAYHDDDRKGECFRVYPNARESYEDHSLFLKRSRYAELFDLKIDDYKRWARGLKKCGYATDPAYSRRLIDLIEENNLEQYDKMGMKMMKKGIVPERKGEEVVAKKEDKKESKGSGKTPTQKSKDSDHIATVEVSVSRVKKVSDNRIRYTIAKEGDNFEKIAEAFEMVPWQVRRYNDLDKGEKLEAGQRIYLQPKKWRAQKDFHVVEEGETMWDISQMYGVKLKKLYKKNNMERGTEPKVGQKLSLRKNL